MRRTITILSTLFLLSLTQCSEEEATTSTPPQREATNPGGSQPLQALDEAVAHQTLLASEEAINHARPLGMTATVQELRTYFESKTNVFDATKLAAIKASLDGITDDTLGKQPTWIKELSSTSSTSSALTSSDTGTKSFALTRSERVTYFECPLNAPEETQTVTCKGLQQEITPKVLAAVAKQQGDVEKWVRDNYKDLCAECLQFVIDWAKEAVKFGSDVAIIDAWQEMYAKGICDDKANSDDVAFYLGVKQGWDIVETFKASALQQATVCGANTTSIMTTVKRAAEGKVEGWMTSHETCKDEDISKVNAEFQAAEAKRKEGIEAGLKDALKALETEVFRTTSQQRCGNSGDPIVLDLTGDGVQLIGERVRFDLYADGSRPRTTWVGAKDGLLARDVDGDGVITSAAELFSDRLACGKERCADGLEALAAADGNGDGVIDARDGVFKQLLVWVDANSDGQSQPEELAPVSEHGLRSFRLPPQGSLSGAIEVTAARGTLQAFDAWFKVEATVQNLKALGPR